VSYQYEYGSGTEEDPYQVWNADDLDLEGGVIMFTRVKFKQGYNPSSSDNAIPYIKEQSEPYFKKQEKYKKPKVVGKIEEEGGEVYWQPQT